MRIWPTQIVKSWVVTHEGKEYKNSLILFSELDFEFADLLGIDIEGVKIRDLHTVKNGILKVLDYFGITEKCRRCGGEGRVTLYTKSIGDICLGCMGRKEKVHLNRRSLKKLKKIVDSLKEEDYEPFNKLVEKCIGLSYYHHKGLGKKMGPVHL